MKKFLALVMALVIVMSLTLTAYAAPAEVTGEFKLANVWVDKDGNTLAVGDYPDIELKFNVTPAGADKNSNAAYDDPEQMPVISVVKPAGSSDFEISGLDAIEGVGIFTYLLDLEDPLIAGVEVDNSVYTLTFLVNYKEEKEASGVYSTEREVSQFDLRNSFGEKVDSIENKYTVSNVTLDKVVTGNLSNGEDKFTMEVFFGSARTVETDILLPDGTVVEWKASEEGMMIASETYSIEICANDDVVTITGVPADVTVFVSEVDPEPYTLVEYTVDGVSTSDVAFAEDDTDTAVVVYNEYKTNIDTGISLDSLPYILVLVAVGGGAAYFFFRKRQEAFEE